MSHPAREIAAGFLLPIQGITRCTPMVAKSNQWTAKEWRAAVLKAVKKRSDPDDNKSPHKLEKLADALVDAGIAGDVPALKEIGDRLDGKVPQAVTGADDGPIQLIVEWAKQE